MARLARVVLPGVPHHVTQRGVRSMDIFYSDEDRKEYLSLLKVNGRKAGVEFLSYCLMSNHVHLIAIPKEEDSLRKGIAETHRLYTRFINFRERVRGHLFQGRFFSCPLSQEHLSVAARYVERNPVRARICSSAEEYLWSSARFHLGIKKNDPLVLGSDWFGNTLDWAEYLREESVNIEILRKHFRTGRPLGDKNFVEQAEQITGRQLVPRKPGRAK